MKNLCFLILLSLGMLSAQFSTAQDTATNQTDEDWRVNYYGNLYTVPANTGINISPGTDCAAGISVWNLACSTPEFFTMSPDSYDTTMCSLETVEVTFTGNADSCSPPYTGTIFENIAIVFVD